MSADRGIGTAGAVGAQLPGFWLSRPVPPPRPALGGHAVADVVVVGGGFTGLWTAVTLAERDPSLRIVLLEATAIGYGASGRNGGFLDPSLTHGLGNGIRHFGDELTELERLAEDNYRGFRDFCQRHAVACDFEPVGMLEVATQPHQVGELREWAELHERFGQPAEWLDADAVREHLNSPLVLAGVRRPAAGGVLDPAALARQLATVAERLGVRVCEGTPVRSLRAVSGGVVAETASGSVLASHAVLAANAYSGQLVRRTARHFVPVYDYVLVSDPLTDDQLAAVGWKQREGVSDSGNQFHYFRLTADNRVLWGGYDAIYYRGNGVGPRYDQRPETFRRLQQHFSAMFPQLAGLVFPYRWGGPIAATTRFTPVFGAALGGRVRYALGYTGLGVAATRFAARVLTDQLLDPASPVLALDYVRRSPFPFPPEPLRAGVVELTRRELARADARAGRRGPWLALLDRFGVGFDS